MDRQITVENTTYAINQKAVDFYPNMTFVVTTPIGDDDPRAACGWAVKDKNELFEEITKRKWTLLLADCDNTDNDNIPDSDDLQVWLDFYAKDFESCKIMNIDEVIEHINDSKPAVFPLCRALLSRGFIEMEDE